MDRYTLISAENMQKGGFFKKMEKKAERCGKIFFIVVSSSEVIIQGENKDLTDFFIWLLDVSRIEKVRHLQFESSEAPES